MVPTGQRMAHSPHRMQRVSSFSITEPATTPEFLRTYVVQLDVQQALAVHKLLHHFRLELKAVEADKLQAVSPDTRRCTRRTGCTGCRPRDCPQRRC